MKQKGITLIALIVTIIVLLILAGVSLRLIAGGDGIMIRASNAVDTNKTAAYNEALEFAMAELKIKYYEEKYANGAQVGTFVQYAKAKLVNGVDTPKGNIKLVAGTNTVIYTDSSNGTTVTGVFNEESAEVAVAGKWTHTSDGMHVTNGAVTLEVGSDITGYSVTVNDITYGDGFWVVLGAENGCLLITPKLIHEGEEITLSGKDDYLGGINKLNEAASYFLNPLLATEARSINLDDICRITLDYPVVARSNTVNSHLYDYGNEVTYTLENGRLHYVRNYISN